jgi:hypothetical protein
MVHIAGSDDHYVGGGSHCLGDAVAERFQPGIPPDPDGNGDELELSHAALKEGKLDFQGVLVFMRLGILHE